MYKKIWRTSLEHFALYIHTHISTSEAELGSLQTSKTESFAKTTNGWKSLTNVAKLSISDICSDRGYDTFTVHFFFWQRNLFVFLVLIPIFLFFETLDEIHARTRSASCCSGLFTGVAFTWTFWRVYSCCPCKMFLLMLLLWKMSVRLILTLV